MKRVFSDLAAAAGASACVIAAGVISAALVTMWAGARAALWMFKAVSMAAGLLARILKSMDDYLAGCAQLSAYSAEESAGSVLRSLGRAARTMKEELKAYACSAWRFRAQIMDEGRA